MGNERSDWGRELGRRVLKGTTGKGGLLESGKNLVQGILPGICQGDPFRFLAMAVADK